MTQNVIQQAMQSDISVASYGKTNDDIFVQPEIDGGQISSLSREYVDNRVLYAEMSYNDPITQYQNKLDNAINERLEAEEHLKWILKQ